MFEWTGIGYTPSTSQAWVKYSQGLGAGELLLLDCLGVKWCGLVRWDLDWGCDSSRGSNCPPALPRPVGVQPQLPYKTGLQVTPLSIRECSLTPGRLWMHGWHLHSHNVWGMVLIWWGCSCTQYHWNLQWGWEKPAVPQSQQWLCLHQKKNILEICSVTLLGKMSMDNIWKFNLALLVLRNMKHLYYYQVGFCKNKDSCAWRRKAEVLPLPPEAVLEGRALEQRPWRRHSLKELVWSFPQSKPHKLQSPLCPPVKEILTFKQLN